MNNNITIITMPFSGISLPSIQLGILKSALVNKNFTVQDLYLNIDYAYEFPDYFTDNVWKNTQISNWLFSASAFDWQADLNSDSGFCLTDFSKDQLINLSQLTNKWLESWARVILNNTPLLVGFSCCFNQLIPSIALAKCLKSLSSTTQIVFGGSEIHKEVAEHLSNDLNIDYFVIGRGEDLLCSLSNKIKNVKKSDKIISQKTVNDRLFSPPIPDFSTYFNILHSLKQQGLVKKDYLPPIAIELSSGCWWKEKKDGCLYCGLNTPPHFYNKVYKFNML